MKLEETLKAHGQEHLLNTKGLSEEEKREYFSRLESIDWNTVELWKNPEDLSGKGEIVPIEGLTVQEIEKRKEEFKKVGIEAIRAGKVAAVLLAGGQGTRLGSSSPKGMYDIGVTHSLYIFEQLIHNMFDVVNACGGTFFPLFIMTSDKNDQETRAFFEEKNYFGYDKNYVRFFVQDMAPSVDFNGKLLLEGKGKLALSPNGNGGWYSSLHRTNIESEFPNVEWLNVFAVDNVLQRIADPVFVGATLESGKLCGAKVVRKAEPREKVGVLCLEDGQPSVIEYYELTDEMANAKGPDGYLAYSFGVILNYLFNRKRLVEIANARIPVHVVKKKVPYLNEKGELVKPEVENGYKFETLVVDMVRLMGSCLPFEVKREHEFAPIKNKTGVDSVESARELLTLNGVKL